MRNVIERAVILAKNDTIEAEDLPMDMRTVQSASGSTPQPGDMISLEKLEEIHVRKVLERTASVAEAAKILGIDDATIYRKRKKMGME